MDVDEVVALAGVQTEIPEEDVHNLLARRPIKNHKGEVIGWGSVLKTSLNTQIVLSADSRMSGRFRYNDFSQMVEIDGNPIKDTDESKIMLWLSSVYDLEMPTKRVSEVVQTIASEDSYHPVRQWLEGLQWDLSPRLDNMLSVYFGAEDSELNTEMARRWAIGCVARIYDPGCKLDTALVLQGPQGAKKSTAFRALAGCDEWFSDTLVDFRNKDAYQQLRGVWIYELAELDNIRRSDIGAIKAFLSAQVDKYRPSYGRHIGIYPRQTAFVGSTNDIEFLPADYTGSRRFWPVRIGTINLPSIKRDTPQIWAEAVKLYKSGERWWLEGSLQGTLAYASEEHRQRDSWETVIGDWLRGQHTFFTIETVLRQAIKKDPDHQTRADSMRAAGILAGLGCVKKRRLHQGSRRVMWSKDDGVVALDTTINQA